MKLEFDTEDKVLYVCPLNVGIWNNGILWTNLHIPLTTLCSDVLLECFSYHQYYSVCLQPYGPGGRHPRAWSTPVRVCLVHYISWPIWPPQLWWYSPCNPALPCHTRYRYGQQGEGPRSTEDAYQTLMGLIAILIKTSWANARVNHHSQAHFGLWSKIWYQTILTSFVL